MEQRIIINKETRVIDLTLEELINALSSSHPPQVQEQVVEEDEIGGIELAVKITGLAKQTIYGKVSSRTIPFMKQPSGKRLYFSRKELLEWLKSHKRITNEEVLDQAMGYIVNNKSTGKR